MNKVFTSLIKVLVIFSLIIFFCSKVYAEEKEIILKQLQEDIKTLEKAVYSQDVKTTASSGDLSSGDNDILTEKIIVLFIDFLYLKKNKAKKRPTKLHLWVFLEILF